MIAPSHKRCPRHADESGSVSVEFALWVPFLVAFLVFIVDVSSLMHIQTVMYDAARDAARQVATGKSHHGRSRDNGPGPVCVGLWHDGLCFLCR